ncbi:MAG: TraR/DksA C4-type zinc finger protein [Vicinamibacterales bacterium]|nr:TraR/DksA C4-type zinc finger protein [Vicinamibacterales bacterium]
MDRDLLAELRARLAARALELRQSMATMADASAPVSPDNAIGRLTRMDAMQQASMQAELHRGHTAELRLVERALEAVESGDYGTCARCGDDIAPARLRAKPEAFLCLACADKGPGTRPGVRS